jgi:hypothetical protein
LRFVVQEGGLIGHVDINRNTSLRDYGLGAAEMVRVGPDIIVVEEAEIGCVGFRGAEVAREAASMALGPRDESKRAHPTRVDGAKDGFICGLMLTRAAIVDDDDLEIPAGLTEHRFQCSAEQSRAIAGRHDDREERH